jgi:hypothetical protein
MRYHWRTQSFATSARDFVSAIDILVGIGWLDAQALEHWRRGQIDCLEELVRANLQRISEAMRLFRSWATARGLFASPTAYVGRTPRRQTLRFSRSGNPAIEASYRTHWVSPELSEKKRERLAEKASHAPELVAVQPLNADWICHRRGGTGDLLMMETPGPACAALASMISRICRRAMPCLRGARKRKAHDMRSSCASAGFVAVTNDKVCWSSRRPWQMRGDLASIPGSVEYH